MTSFSMGFKPIKERQIINEWALKVYAGALCTLILLFALLYWGPHLSTKYRKSTPRYLRTIPGYQNLRRMSRAVRSYTLHQIPGFPSLGHAVLTAIYLILNFTLCIINVKTHKLSNPAARLGWMATANILLAVFLGLKNTPLRVLTSETYNRLNFLHRAVGYTAVAQTLLHAILYMICFGGKNRWDIFIYRPNLEGSISGVGMLMLLLGIFRTLNYEVFYVSHIIGVIVTITFAALHRPSWVQKVPIIMVIAAAIWVVDRLIRGTFLLFNLRDGTATIYPLPRGGIKLVMRTPRAAANPGLHCFVWIPGIRAFQTHPFTITSHTTSSLEMIVKSHAGFTKDLYEFAVSNPGSVVNASIDGPYGSLPNLKHYDKLVFIAGGSGAAFTFGLMDKWLSQLQPGSTQLVHFIWTVREKENLAWFADHLDELSCHPSQISVALHVTGESISTSPCQYYSPGSSTPTLIASGDFLPQIARGGPVESLYHLTLSSRLAASLEEYEHERLLSETPESMDLESRFDIKYQRLRANDIISDIVRSTGVNQQVLVAACGPRSLMKDVMMTVGSCMRSDGPSIEVHCENFDL
ncbi:ferric reductase NAD binding domain-containing protein [Dactylonectria macrodidyma]|uniref:Ferric reductase NAD binding domain-containing protein n=1 Tax=Dactylonectria macrodidyma TaxID=307937 RepID=A0A9P9JGU8_9HYPO|nr:ferric reductase NAD binding domain-containing protein [Dactylonectria macrodidyma]